MLLHGKTLGRIAYLFIFLLLRRQVFQICELACVCVCVCVCDVNESITHYLPDSTPYHTLERQMNE